MNGVSGETPITVADSISSGPKLPKIILNSLVTKIEKGGTDKDPWVKVTAGNDSAFTTEITYKRTFSERPPVV